MAKLFKEIGKSINDYGAAIHFIFKNKLAWFFLFPLILNILLFLAGMAAVDTLLENLQQNILAIDFLKNADFFGAGIIRWLVNGFLWIVIKILFFFVFSYFGGYITLAIISPILAFLSEKTEKILLGNVYEFDIQQLMRDVVRAVLIVIRNSFFSLLIVILVFILSFVPVVGWIIALLSPFILFVSSAYFYGFSFVDYVIERQRVDLKTSVSFMKEHKGILIGNGSVFSLVLLIPFGNLLAGFVAIISTVAAVISVQDFIKTPLNKKESLQKSIEK